MTRFRPCIDLHSGQVKQIVGGTLSNVASELKTNYVSKLPASHYAAVYRDNGLRGGHVVMLGPGNDDAAIEALKTWPGGLQVAGGITDKNARYWIDQGAEKVRIILLGFYFASRVLHGVCAEMHNIVKCGRVLIYDEVLLSGHGGRADTSQVIITSFLFPEGKFSLERLQSVLAALDGDKSKLVLDLSCRRKGDTWFVAMNRWQTITEMEINQGLLLLVQ